MPYEREISEGDFFRYHMIDKFGVKPKKTATESQFYGTAGYYRCDLEPKTMTSSLARTNIELDFLFYRKDVYDVFLKLNDEHKETALSYTKYLTDLRAFAIGFMQERTAGALVVTHTPKSIPLYYRSLDLNFYDVTTGQRIAFSRATRQKKQLKTYLFGHVKVFGRTITIVDAIDQTLEIVRNGPYTIPAGPSSKEKLCSSKQARELAFLFPEKVSYNKTPSVYILYNEKDQPLYVGKSRHLGKRLKTHLEESSFGKEISKVGVLQFKSSRDMDLVEIAKIHEHDPLYNKDCKPDNEPCIVSIECDMKEKQIPLWELPSGITGVGNFQRTEEKLITLRGLHMHNKEILRHVLMGTGESYLELKEEPENRFDKDAIAVYARGEFYGKVGYVGKEFTDTVRQLIATGRYVSVDQIYVRIPEALSREVPSTLDVYIS